jgi:hypothetical protein
MEPLGKSSAGHQPLEEDPPRAYAVVGPTVTSALFLKSWPPGPCWICLDRVSQGTCSPCPNTQPRVWDQM